LTELSGLVARKEKRSHAVHIGDRHERTGARARLTLLRLEERRADNEQQKKSDRTAHSEHWFLTRPFRRPSWHAVARSTASRRFTTWPLAMCSGGSPRGRAATMRPARKWCFCLC